MIKLATVFSGIGSIEQALNRLGVEHKIVFACDNGDMELRLFDKETQTYYNLLQTKRGKRTLTADEEQQLFALSKQENDLAENVRNRIYGMDTKQE